MQSRLTARMTFMIALGLLLVCAILVWSTIVNLAESERLVTHTHQVQELLGDTESAIASAARARLHYVFSGDDGALRQYQSAVGRIGEVMASLRQSTADNPAQSANCDRLQSALEVRMQLWEKSVALKRSGLPAPEGQPEMTRQSVAFADEILHVTGAMRAEEARLLKEHTGSLQAHFTYAIVALAASFTASVLLLLWHYRLLRAELQARETAQQQAADAARSAIEAERKAHQSERAALVSQDAARRLSARLLQLRDDERRKFSRELHDSLGQSLAAAKMLMQQLAAAHGEDKRYTEPVNLIEESIRETRTISHLLHPPGLDEAGFSSAATWFAEGFAKRSGLEVKVNIAELAKRMPQEVELALFRVLQESLINIHRHSKSTFAEAIFQQDGDAVILAIKDRGAGIPAEVLERFQAAGTSGVGLAGMRERIRELGGSFEVTSGESGTVIRVVVPLAKSAAADLNA
jgi:signal transduction histidine kinase